MLWVLIVGASISNINNIVRIDSEEKEEEEMTMYHVSKNVLFEKRVEISEDVNHLFPTHEMKDYEIDFLMLIFNKKKQKNTKQWHVE